VTCAILAAALAAAQCARTRDTPVTPAPLAAAVDLHTGAELPAPVAASRAGLELPASLRVVEPATAVDLRAFAALPAPAATSRTRLELPAVAAPDDDLAAAIVAACNRCRTCKRCACECRAPLGDPLCTSRRRRRWACHGRESLLCSACGRRCCPAFPCRHEHSAPLGGPLCTTRRRRRWACHGRGSLLCSACGCCCRASPCRHYSTPRWRGPGAPARCQECISSWHSDRDSLLQPASRVCGLQSSGFGLPVEQVSLRSEAGSSGMVLSVCHLADSGVC
jgi:hypothetical protein